MDTLFIFTGVMIGLCVVRFLEWCTVRALDHKGKRLIREAQESVANQNRTQL